MKVIFIPDNPYISKLIRPSELIEARTTDEDYIESALGVNYQNPEQFELVPWKRFEDWSYIQKTAEFPMDPPYYYEPFRLPILTHKKLKQLTPDIQNFLTFLTSNGVYFREHKFQPGYYVHHMNYWFICYSQRHEIPQQLLDTFDKLHIEYEISTYMTITCPYKDSDAMLEKLYPTGDMDITIVDGALIDNYFCEGPFDLSKLDFVDDNSTYPYAVFLEQYVNEWTSTHRIVFTDDECWYDYLLELYQKQSED